MADNPFEAPFQYKRLAASIAHDMGLEPEKVLGRKKTREYAHARAILTRFLLDRGWSLSRIGRILGRDHSTICFARDNLPVYLGHYPEVMETYQRHCNMRAEVQV